MCGLPTHFPNWAQNPRSVGYESYKIIFDNNYIIIIKFNLSTRDNIWSPKGVFQHSLFIFIHPLLASFLLLCLGIFYVQCIIVQTNINLHRIFKSSKSKYIDNYLFQLKTPGSGELCDRWPRRIFGGSKYI